MSWLDDAAWDLATDPGVFWFTDGEGIPLGIGLIPEELLAD